MCGIAGVIGKRKARHTINASLLALQSRAQDFAGMTIMTTNKTRNTYNAKGHVWEVFKPKRLKKLRGRAGIGHIRYPTSDDKVNCQPLDRDWGSGWIALAHNGNFTNAKSVRTEVFQDTGFNTGMDTETLLRLILEARTTMPDTIEELVAVIDQAQGQLSGSASVVILTPLGLTVMRDYSGNRPLVYGQYPHGGFAVASEESALTANGIYVPEEVPLGTIMHFTEDTQQQWTLQHGQKPVRKCVFELAYFTQPCGDVFGNSVEDFRLALGRQLADEHPIAGGCLVIPVQDSGLVAGYGFYERICEQQAAQHRHGSLIRNKYAGRMFIADTEKTRDATVRRKFMANPRDIRGREVVLVDDSLVRSNTSEHLVAWFKAMGAAKVHFRSAFPVWRYPCQYGIATKSIKELAITTYKTERGIADAIGVDTLGFISPEGLETVVAEFADPGQFCNACYRHDAFW